MLLAVVSCGSAEPPVVENLPDDFAPAKGPIRNTDEPEDYRHPEFTVSAFGGDLLGIDRGEWGGKLFFRGSDGSTVDLVPENVQAILPRCNRSYWPVSPLAGLWCSLCCSEQREWGCHDPAFASVGRAADGDRDVRIDGRHQIRNIHWRTQGPPFT
jgi:hypothetical protein